ncbi:ExbD/TolR family protein [Foetidibacter luteolus]|uniref:ExbD/TolR family protein n=1 Tax=Foetidibacter luteolus TaxID=2608880 RepID=UPI00129AF849|nr:biopolymer transporter ExbD [Foetidibacter luteolus]
MSRPKIARKSTNIDMTAMCDVAFLLLSFFILTTKFKPSEAVPVNTPNSVAAKVAPEKDIVMISLNNEGKVFISTGDGAADKDKKEQILQSINNSKGLGLTDAEIKALVKAPFIGVPFTQLAGQAKLPTEQMNAKLPGIPVQDSTNNQMIDWMRAVAEVYAGTKPNLLLKGDNVAKYPAFKNIITAFKKNDLMKFQMVTNPESVPSGTDLWKANMKGVKQEDL